MGFLFANTLYMYCNVSYHLSHIHMVIRMDRRFAAKLSTKNFNSSVANNLIDIHIGLCARSGLPDNKWKMIIQFAIHYLKDINLKIDHYLWRLRPHQVGIVRFCVCL